MKYNRKIMMQKIIAALVLSVALVGAAQDQSPAIRQGKTQARLEKQLRDADLAFAKATHERRIEGLMEFFADDGAIIQDGKALTGKPAIREFYTPVFADKSFSLSWVPTKAEVSRDGTLGYTYGDFEAKTANGTSRGMYVTVWRKVNGEWRVVLDLGSHPRQQPAAAEQPQKKQQL